MKMLGKARDQITRFKDLVDTISGFIFMATPHYDEVDTSVEKFFTRFLQGSLKHRPKDRFFSMDLHNIANISRRFEEMSTYTSILSCYETKCAKLRRKGVFGQMWDSERAILADKDLVNMNLKEEFVAIDVELSQIFFTPSSGTYKSILAFLERVMPSAISRLKCQNLSSLSPMRSGKDAESFVDVVMSESDMRRHVATKLPCRLTKSVIPDSKLFGRTDILYQVEKILLNGLQMGEPSSISQWFSLKNPKRYTIFGPGGVGKTQIAIQFASQYQHDFQAVAWIQAGSREKLKQGYVEFASALGLTGGEEELTDYQIVDILKSWLSNPRGRENDTPVTWLLILDGADDLDDLHDFWPKNGKGSVLVITRDPLAGYRELFEGPKTDLSSLTVEHSAQLLLQQAGASQDAETLTCAKLIAQELHCYPLAIVQIAGIISRQQASLSHFLETWRKDNKRMRFYKKRTFHLQGYRLTLEQIMSAQHFSSGGLSSECQALIRIMSFLDHHCIPEVILTTNPQKLHWSSFPDSASTYTECLEELFKGSLVRRIPEKQELSIHPLVQDVVRSEVMESLQTFDHDFNAAVQLICTVWPCTIIPRLEGYSMQRMDGLNGMSVAEQCNELVHHVESVWKIFDKLERPLQTACATAEFVSLLAEAAWYERGRSDIPASLDFFQRALDVQEISHDDMKDVLASIHSTRGAIAFEIGPPDIALLHTQTFYRLTQELYAKDNVPTRTVAASYSELARAYMMNGIVSPVPDLLDKSINMRKQLSGFNPVQLFNPLHQMGLYYLIQSKFEEATTHLESALEHQRSAYGSDENQGARSTATLLYQLGDVRYKQYQLGTYPENFLNESFTYMTRAKGIFQKTLGAFHPETAKTAFKLSVLHLACEEYDEARSQLEHAYEAYCKHPEYRAALARVTY
ncbi:MAG: hypothetical protein Q9159_002227 [Coniocarpon cinnabarinum]